MTEQGPNQPDWYIGENGLVFTDPEQQRAHEDNTASLAFIRGLNPNDLRAYKDMLQGVREFAEIELEIISDVESGEAS